MTNGEKPIHSPSHYLTTDEVAEYFKVSRRTVQNWIKAGWLSCLAIGEGKGATYRVSVNDVKAFEKKYHRR